MEASKVDMFELLCKLEERVAALEKELHTLKNGKCNESSKSRQQLVKNIPLDDYETYIEKMNDYDIPNSSNDNFYFYFGIIVIIIILIFGVIAFGINMILTMNDEQFFSTDSSKESDSD